MFELRGYVAEGGDQPFAKWFSQLDSNTAARITTALARIEQGNFSNVKGVGSGVFEYKIDFGPGYRVYFAKDGELVVILLGGGSKKRQSKDIVEAHERWADFKRRKRQEIH